MKKEISDHLAKTFFDKKAEVKQGKNTYFIIALTLFLLAGFGSAGYLLFKPTVWCVFDKGQHIIFEKHDGPYILNFDFTNAPSKQEGLKIDIPDIDLSGYKQLKFSVRVVSEIPQQLGSLKVGVVTKRQEISSLYISEINNSWKKVVVLFSDFKNISDWSGIAQLSFTLEEWNTNPKKGKLMVDSIEFLN